MPLTRLQYQTRVQQNLNDLTGVYFDQASVLDSLSDGYDEILLESQCYESVATINFSSNAIYYDVYNSISNFYRPVRMFNNVTQKWLRFVDSRYLDKLRWDWEVANNTPWWAYIINHQYIGLFPHYAAVTNQSFDLLYKVGKDALTSDSQLVQIPDPYNKLLENYATADLLETINEFKKAKASWDDYNKQLEKLKIHVNSRMKSYSEEYLNQIGGY